MPHFKTKVESGFRLEELVVHLHFLWQTVLTPFLKSNQWIGAE